MAASDPLTVKHRPRHKKHHPKWFSSKVMVKNVFLQNGYQRNAFTYVSRRGLPVHAESIERNRQTNLFFLACWSSSVWLRIIRMNLQQWGKSLDEHMPSRREFIFELNPCSMYQFCIH